MLGGDAVGDERPVHIHGEYGGNGVDLGSHGSHDRGNERRKHQAQNAGWQHRHQVRIRLIGPRQIGREGERRNSRQHDDHRHQQLEEARQHDALLGLPDVLGSQRPLNDVLVEAPVRHVHDP